MLEEAIKRIGSTIHAFKLVDDDDCTVMASVKIDIRPHYCQLNRNFMENQLSLPVILLNPHALAYLLTMGIITIDDANSVELKKCQRQLKAKQVISAI